MIGHSSGMALRLCIAGLALLTLSVLPLPDASAGIVEDLLKLKKAREEAERQRKEQGQRPPQPQQPQQPQPTPAQSVGDLIPPSTAEAESIACGPKGCRKRPDDPSPDQPVIDDLLRQLGTPCVRRREGGQREWAGYTRYVDLAEVLRSKPGVALLSVEEIEAARVARRFPAEDVDWKVIHNAGSYVIRHRNPRAVDSGVWMLDASPVKQGDAIMPAVYAFVVDPARLPEELRAAPLTPVDQFLQRVQTARRDQQERQICKAPPQVATGPAPTVLKLTPTWLNAAGAPEEREAETRPRPPGYTRLFSAGVFAVNAQTGALSELPGAAGFNAAGYGGGGTTRAVLDRSGRVLFRSTPLGLAGLLVSSVPIRTGPSVRTQLQLESQPVLHPKLDVIYLITGEYEGKPSRHGISAFRFDAASGVLTPVSGSSAPLGALDAQDIPNFDVRVAPDGGAAYLYDGFQRLHAFRIDAATGALSPVPGTPFQTQAAAGRHDVLSVHPSSRFVWLALQGGGHQGFVVQAGSGALATMPPMPLGNASCTSRHKLVFDPTGAFGYATAQSSRVILCTYAIDRASGSLTAMAPLASPRVISSPLGPHFSPNGRFLYLENYDDTQPTKAYEIIVLALDPASGALRHVGTSRQNGAWFRAPGSGHCGTYRGRLTFDSTGEFLYGPEWSYQVDPVTGALTGQAQDPRDRGNCFTAG